MNMLDLKITRATFKRILTLGTALFITACGSKFQAMNLAGVTSSSASNTSPGGPGHIVPATMPTAAVGLTEFPNNMNTGVPPGTTLKTTGAITINTPGTIIDGLDINGSLSITANNVTIRNSKITVASFAVVRILADLKGVVLEDCTISGVGVGNDGSLGIQGPGTFLRNNIYNVDIGVSPDSGALIQDNYIHDLRASGVTSYNGVQIEGGAQNILITHNSIINQNTKTAAVMIDNFFGPVQNIDVENNLLGGGTYTVYSDGQYTGGAITGVVFTGNHLRPGLNGYHSFKNNAPLFTGNVDDTTGNLIP